MGIRIPPEAITIRYTGLFDFDALYREIIEWCKNYEYVWHEETYKHKPTPKGAEQEWYWYAEKEVTGYVKYIIHFYPRAWEITELEVKVSGKKKKLIKARMEISIQGELIFDWQNKFTKNKFARLLGKLYNKMVRRELDSVYGDNLYYRLWNLQSVIKKFFNMQTKWHEYEKYLKED